MNRDIAITTAALDQHWAMVTDSIRKDTAFWKLFGLYQELEFAESPADAHRLLCSMSNDKAAVLIVFAKIGMLEAMHRKNQRIEEMADELP